MGGLEGDTSGNSYDSKRGSGNYIDGEVKKERLQVSHGLKRRQAGLIKEVAD